ncbi:UDP-glycosyltransferase 83A1 [Sesamum alatum]|uniref:UDP-glycosyltransferase 83A1 n=1 Tax=Sesamum alatum TaxID=300844 RepID=A0AAE2CWG0_9LAMI|nr:UDP-glycosyltransferase 83A1 [Sesamum alatum]
MAVNTAKGKRPHVLAVPFPAQGHVGPLMKLCRLIANHGIKVTFVNTQHIHNRILAASLMLSDQDTDDKEEDNMVLTSIPDGLAPDDDRNDRFKLVEVGVDFGGAGESWEPEPVGFSPD